MPRNPKPAGFEQTLSELETLVTRMEAGDLPLAEALLNFERGVQLTRACQQALQNAQQQVQILLQKPAGAALDDFAAAPDADS